MRLRLSLVVIAGSAGLLGGACVERPGDGPPPTPVVQAADTVAGIIVDDPYRWLENDDSAAVHEWVAKQNAWTDAVLSGSPVNAQERQFVFGRIVELLRTDAASVPLERAGRYFFMRRSADQDRAAIYIREGIDGVDHRIIDPYTLPDSIPPSITLLAVTADGGVITYAVQRAGDVEAEIRFHDVERDEDLPFRLPAGRYAGAELLPDRSGVYYTRLEEDGPRLRYRPLSGGAAGDTLVFGENLTSANALGAAVSANGRWLGIVVFRGPMGRYSDVYAADLQGGARIRPVITGIDARFLPAFTGNSLVVQTDWQAPGGRILRVPLEDPRPRSWTEIVAEPTDAVIEGMTAAGGRIFVSTTADARSRLEVYDSAGGTHRPIELPFPGTVSDLTAGWSGRDIFFMFESFHVPLTIERFDVAADTLTTWFSPAVAIPSDIVVRQETVTSADGTQVPLYLVHRAGLSRDGRSPVLLTAFGAFGVSLAPGFTSEAVIVAERGGVFAVVNARGGGEFGEAWHEAARGAAKPKAIDDIIAAAEWLISEGYARPETLALTGATHGGMLVAAAMTRRPELFGAVVARQPLTDMTRFGPSTPAWVAEYGSPSDSADLVSLLGYSPYHNVQDTITYPPVLLMADDASAVPPFHARKMVARLQALPSGGPFLLREDTVQADAGPARASTIFDLADLLTFVLERTRSGTAAGPRS